MKITLDKNVMASFKPAKIFPSDCKVTSIDISSNGNFVVATRTNNVLSLFDVKEGQQLYDVPNTKYGCEIVRFTHHKSNVIFSCNDNVIRYLSFHDCQYLRYFKGFHKKIASLEVSPLDDTFIGASENDAVCLFDIRSSVCQGRMKISGKPLVAYDPQGVIFAIALDNRTIRMYAMDSYQSGPFSIFDVKSRGTWQSIEFSNNGKTLLISTSLESKVLDSFTGEIKTVIEAPKCIYTPDSMFLLSPGESVKVWDPITGGKVSLGVEADLIKFNPKYAMMVTATTDILFWLTASQ